MGCRTRVIGNAHDPSREIVTGRGNLSFTSINMSRLAINAKGNVGAFFDSLDEMTGLCIAKPMAELARKVRSYNEMKLNVVTYTGYTFEQLISLANEENGFMELLKETDYLIEGRF